MSNIERFTSEYLGKVFYYCLKKTGNEQDAAELSGDIGLEIVQALLSGKVPDNFDAWLWAVVRNRWAKWATKKYYKCPEQVDIQDYAEELPSEESLEASVLHREELDLIRRELAFIREDYRKILVAHYFEEKSVSQIAAGFGIPIGTVKTRLQSSRKILKEGMNMARKFGTRSFNPETIHFAASGHQPTALPWLALGRKIPENILCEANNNPTTIEEFSMELGIAMPYMEEEVSILEECELLRKLKDGKYITNFFISPKECQDEINELGCIFAERHYKTIWELAGMALEKYNELSVSDVAASRSDMQAYFAFQIEQRLENDAQPQGIFAKFKRMDGGSWGIIGKEQGAICRLPRAFFNNNSSDWREKPFWNEYLCGDAEYGSSPYKQNMPDYSFLGVLGEVVRGKRKDDFSDKEKKVYAKLIKNGYCVKGKDGKIQLATVVFQEDNAKKLDAYLMSLPAYKQLEKEMRNYIQELTEVIRRYSVPYLEEDFDYYVAMSSELRSIFARLWKDKGLYTGGNARFAALYC
ncbi:MAG: RNA polymerase sigma factor [Lachnospiraceae bacterium]|nr:RNA polymerase sigma factor [Lachnospiraceae bacterium]